MNVHAILAIYKFEMARTLRTVWQSIVSPVISTSLYFVVFGAAIGSRITEIEGIAYGAFIVPGHIMLTLLTQSTMNASFWLFVPIHIAHPLWMIGFLVLTAVTFSLLGFIIGVWADGFEQLQIVPMLIIMPLTFLGGTFYSTQVLPPLWQKIALANPVVYLVSGFRWSFFEISDVAPAISLGMTLVFMVVCLAPPARPPRPGP